MENQNPNVTFHPKPLDSHTLRDPKKFKRLASGEMVANPHPGSTEDEHVINLNPFTPSARGVWGKQSFSEMLRFGREKPPIYDGSDEEPDCPMATTSEMDEAKVVEKEKSRFRKLDLPMDEMIEM